MKRNAIVAALLVCCNNLKLQCAWRHKDIANNKHVNVFSNNNNLKNAGDIVRRGHTCQYMSIKFSYLFSRVWVVAAAPVSRFLQQQQ